MGINFAMCELAGHFFLPKDEDFEIISEEFILKLANEAKFDSKYLEKIKLELFEIFKQNENYLK